MKVVALCPELTPTIVARSGWGASSVFFPTPHNATAGDPGKLPDQFSYLSVCLRRLHPPLS